MFTLTRCFISDGLFGKVHFHFHLRISKDRVEEFLQKSFSNNYRKYEVVQLIIFVNIGKEARYYHTETISGNRPGCVFAAGTRTKVLSCHQYLSAIRRIVQHEILIQRTVGIITPVTKQVITEKLLFTSRCFQKTCRNNLVSIYIL